MLPLWQGTYIRNLIGRTIERYVAWPDGVPASFWFTRSERRRLHASSRGAPLGTVRLRTATWTKACDPSATASALPLGRLPTRGKTPPGYAAATARLTPRARLATTAHWRQDTDAPRPAAGQGLALSVCGAGASSSSPPVFGRGGASGAQDGGPLPLPGSRLGTALLRTGGEEECTRTADTNPGCNYLVRGYIPSMHYFWRGDMPHFSSSLPFQRGDGQRQRRSPDPRKCQDTFGGRAVDLGRPDRGTRGCRAAEVPRQQQMVRHRPRPARVGRSRSRAAAVSRPPRPARPSAPSISAGVAPLAGAGQRTPLQTGASQAQPAQPKCGGA